MRRRWTIARIGCTAFLLIALGGALFAAGAGAELTGEFKTFQQCQWKASGIDRCVFSETTGGEVKLGSKEVPIVKPVVLQGGYGLPAESGPEKTFAEFYAAKNGKTLSETPQPVPGGLVGLVPPEKAPPLVKAALKLALENGFTGVDTTLELVGPASEIRVSEIHLAEEVGVALILPLKAHLENPFLGPECYVGSKAAPIVWELTVGKTAPKPPIEPIKGSGGETEFLEEAEIIRLKDALLVDNTWTAPKATGCGGLLAALVDPIIDSQAGLPSPEGSNVARLKSTITESTAFAVNLNDETHP